MKILYYVWNEITEEDVYEHLKKMNADVDKFDHPIIDKLNDLPFTKTLSSILDNTKYDCIYSTNYYPIISKIAYAYGIKYISWSFDSNPFVFYTNSIFNDTNYIFTYDYCDYTLLHNLGVNHVFHMPLAVNTNRINALINPSVVKYNYDVSFLGTLYNNEYNFYDQIKNMPAYNKGYIDAIINAQMDIYGADLADTLITDEFYAQISPFIQFNLEDELFITPRELFISFVRKKITVTERVKLLKEISKKYKLTHFASKSSPELNNTIFKGYANYYTEMPIIFNTSKINLNITLREIRTAIPLRCMDIMGAGGFLLSNYQPELAELFENGTEMVMYESHADALDKIEYYLSHEKEREEIAANGKRKIEKNYTYDIAFHKIFELCGLK